MADEPITAISADLRRQILEGTLGPGALMPSEPEVARQYGVSRQTARVALQALEQEGLLVVRPRRGRHGPQSPPAALAPVRVREAGSHRPIDIGRPGNRHRAPGPRPHTPGPPRRADHPAQTSDRRGTPEPGPAPRHEQWSAGTCATSTASPRSSPMTTSARRSCRAPSWLSLRTPRARTSSPRLAASRSTTSTRSSSACRHPRRQPAGDHRRNTGSRARQDRLHRQWQAGQNDDLDHSGGHADPAVHHPDLIPDKRRSGAPGRPHAPPRRVPPPGSASSRPARRGSALWQAAIDLVSYPRGVW